MVYRKTKTLIGVEEQNKYKREIDPGRSAEKETMRKRTDSKVVTVEWIPDLQK